MPLRMAQRLERLCFRRSLARVVALLVVALMGCNGPIARPPPPAPQKPSELDAYFAKRQGSAALARERVAARAAQSDLAEWTARMTSRINRRKVAAIYRRAYGGTVLVLWILAFIRCAS